MNKQQVLLLISNTNNRSFHVSFEKNFQISHRIRDGFQNDELLSHIRKAYLYEYLAELSALTADKIDCYNSSLQHLISTPQPIKPDHLLFLCHSIAKINYQLGVSYMRADPSLIEEGLKHAKHYFDAAVKSYNPFKIEYEYTTIETFLEATYLLHPQFELFDSYSPAARLISCTYNLYSCCEEDIECDVSMDNILSDIRTYIAFIKDTKDSISYNAIQEVTSSLQQINDTSLALYDESCATQIIATEQQAEPTTKRRKREAPVEPKHSKPRWKPSVFSFAQFISTFESSHWSIPGFLRRRQQQDLTEIYNGFQRYTKPLLVTKPTGTGKTAEFTAVTNSAYQNGVMTIIVVPTTTLVKQTKTKLIEYTEHSTDLAYDDADISMYSPTEGFRETGAITIVTMASFINLTKKALETFPTTEILTQYLAQYPHTYDKKEVVFHPDFFSLLIIDEGHHVEGVQFYNIITRASCERPKILFSASTMPGEYPKIDRACEPVIIQTLKDAIVAGELSPLQMLTLDFSMYPEAKELTRSIRRKLRTESTVHIEEDVGNLLHQNIGFSYTAASIIKQISEKVPTTQKVMVFTDSIDHANLLAKILTLFFKKRVDAFHTQAHNRSLILERFQSTPKSIIVAVGALDEGFDDPDVNLILDFSVYRSRIRRLVQRIGRAERIRADGSSAIILNIKVLPEDLQLLPRDVIMGANQPHSYLGLPEEHVISEQVIDLVLPPPITINHEVENVLFSREIVPQGAQIVFPKNKRRHKIGMPPVDEDFSFGFFSAASNAYVHPVSTSSSSSSQTFTTRESSVKSFTIGQEDDEEDWVDLLGLFG